MSDLNLPPFNLEAEEAVIGSVLIDSESFFDVAQHIGSRDFHIVKHQWIWKVFEYLHDHGLPFDLLTVQNELTKRNQLNELGGAAYLTKLITLTPTAYNAWAYAKLVAECATRRRMIQSASEIAKLAYEAGTDIDTCVTNAMASLSSIVTVRGGAQQIEKHMSKTFDVVSERYENPELAKGLMTGLVDLDDVTGGLQTGLLYYLSGDAGKGKTVLAIQMARALAKQKPGAIYELEMRDVDVCQRLLAADDKLELDTRTMRSGELSEQQFSNFTKGVNDYSRLPIFLSDASSTNTMGLRADLMRLKAEGVKWAIVDYLNLLTDKYGNDAQERQSYISRQLRSIAKDLDVALLVIQSVNKTGQLSGPNSIKHDCDLLMEMTDHLVDEDDEGRVKQKPNPNVRTLTFSKTRFDTGRRIELLMRPGPRFVDTTHKNVRGE